MEVLLFSILTAIPWADLAPLFTAIVVLLTAWLAQKSRTKIADGADSKATEIHVLVNSRLQAALDRIKELEQYAGLKEDAQVPK